MEINRTLSICHSTIRKVIEEKLDKGNTGKIINFINLKQHAFLRITVRIICTFHSLIRNTIDMSASGLADEENCMLDLLLSLKDEENNTGFTSQELQDHVMTFMSAGHEVRTKMYLIFKSQCCHGE